MTDVSISIDGTGGYDLTVVDGDLWTIPEPEGEDDSEAVGQRVLFNLSTWLAESPYGQEVGVPYLDGVFGDAPLGSVVVLLTQVVLDTDGVADLDEEPVFSLESDSRELTLVLAIVTARGYRRRLEFGVRPA